MKFLAFALALIVTFASFGTELADSGEVCAPAQTYDQQFALKTNLLYWPALMPNAEVEWRFDPRWSVAVDGGIAWWGKGHRKYRLATVSPEVRYRLGQTPRLRKGMYVGAFAGGGLYDLENRHNGYKGEGLMAGVSFGYTWPVSRHLSLEAGIGAGYMYTRYKEYEPKDNHFLYLRTKSLNYFGPLKLKLSLVWHFGAEVKTAKNESVE